MQNQKHSIIYAIDFGFSCICFLQCNNKKRYLKKLKSDINYSSNDQLLTLEVVWCTSTDKNLFETEAGFTEFTITFENNTDKTAEIISENFSVVYGGVSYTPFVSGQRHIKANESMPPMSIPPNT